MAASRPEAAPAMGYFNHVSFGDSVWALADDDDMEELPSTVKLAYASADLSFSNAGASMADVARVLYDCRPMLPESVAMIRQQAFVQGVAAGCLREKQSSGHASVNEDAYRHSSLEVDAQKIVATLQQHMESRPLPRVQNPKYKQRRLPVRHLRVNDSGINAQELDDVSALLCGHATLSTLALQSSELLPRPSGLFARLAAAISLSNLRVIELSNNPIGPRSMCEFLNHLCSPNLSHLYLSMTMQQGLLHADQQMNPLWREGNDVASWQEGMDSEAGKKALWLKEIARVTDLLIDLVSPSGSKPPRASAPKMQAPYAPRLTLLSLNGNDLRWRNVQRLVTAILQGNTSLTHVELFATCDNEDSDDEEDHEARQSSRASRTGGVRRVTSIGSAMRAQQRQERDTSLYSQQGPITPPRNVGSSAIRPEDALRQPFHQSSSARDRLGHFQTKPVRKSDWRRVLGSHLWNNRFTSLEVKIAARRLLGPARILTCRCRIAEKESPDTSSPFAQRLPPEIWRRIIGHLDTDGKLSTQQIERIISFASDPSTIGYGSRSSNLGLSSAAQAALAYKGSPSESAQDSTSKRTLGDDYGLLPHRRWQWADMIARHSVPRDWPAQVIDETGKDNGDALLVEEAGLMGSRVGQQQDPVAQGALHGRTAPAAAYTRTDRHEHDGGGGGGPDGEGGVTLSGPAGGQGATTALPSRSRRVWLDEQSALQAFYEATATYCAESEHATGLSS